MHFASPLPAWFVVVLVAAIVGFGVVSYWRTPAPLARSQRSALIVLRVLTMAAVVAFLCRPVIMLPPATARDIVIPVLVDTSRSMSVADAGGQTRLERARSILQRELLPAL